MSVVVSLRGSVGDRMFQYALGRLVAQHHGVQLNCLAREHWNGLFPFAPSHIGGDVVDDPVCRLSCDAIPGWDRHLIDCDRLYGRGRSRFELDGYFQRFEYFHHRFDAICQWFRSPGPASCSIADVSVHVSRQSTFAHHGWLLSRDYYDRAIAAYGGGSTRIYGDALTDDVADMCDAYQAEFVQASGRELVGSFGASHTVILSNDTTSWWAAMLSDANLVVGPHADSGAGFAFTGFGNVDLRPNHRDYRALNAGSFCRGVTVLHSHILGGRVLIAGDRVVVMKPDGSLIRISGEPALGPLVRTLTSGSSFDLATLTREHGSALLQRACESLVRAGICGVTVSCT